MNKSVLINLGSGDLYEGFPRVTAQLRSTANALPEQYIGSLPAAPELVELYRNWQLIYRSLCARFQLLSPQQAVEDDELEMGEGLITNISELSFEELCQQLQGGLNDWLKSESFRNIDQQVRSQLDPTEEIQVVFVTNDELIRRLPWQRWDFFQDYPKAEMALSGPEYKRQDAALIDKTPDKVRILAILGNTQGIDLEVEQQFLASLKEAQTQFLINPTRQEFNEQLWDSDGWDILFFAGHSQTEGETGRIYLNENPEHNSLTLEQLEEALKTAIDNGLKLAIFNSCDGLGLAQTLEKLNIPVAIVLREPVPNRVAQVFFKHFLEAFAVEQLSLYLSVQQSRRKLQGLEDEFPGASWLPAICQNPAIEPPTWIRLGGVPNCPYCGLSAFREEDASYFFGREQFIESLQAAVKKKPLVVVVGASGSGKTSVLLAGLIPKLKTESSSSSPPFAVSFRPGNNPFKSLAYALAPIWQLQQSEWQLQQSQKLEEELRQSDHFLSNLIEGLVLHNPETQYILILDQFEELFTLCSETDSRFFIASLLHAVETAPCFTLVLALRADFYRYLLEDPAWSDMLQGAVLNLKPMSREELQTAIEQPAALLSVGLETGLTDKLIQEIEGHSGRLPILGSVLMQLWSKQQRGWLTHQAYEEIGGVTKSFADHAEATYSQLNSEERSKAQQIFMQLVNCGKDRETTQRIATRAEVKPENWNLVSRLATARLVATNWDDTNGEEKLEMIHEALLQSWGRLEQWISADGAFRHWQEQLRTSLHTWENSDRDKGALLRGKSLTDAEDWLQEYQAQISDKGKEFIQLSLDRREHKIRQGKRRLVLLRLLLGLTSTAFIISAALGLTAVWQARRATLSQIQAISTSSDNLFALNKRLEALIQSIRAKRLLTELGGSEPATEARVNTSLLQSLYGVDELNRFQGGNTAEFSADGKQIFTNYNNDILILNRDGTQVRRIAGHKAALWSIAFSPNHRQIASASEDGTAKIWTLDGRLASTLIGHKAGLRDIAFSPSRKASVKGFAQMLATASDDGTVKLWHVDGKMIQTLRAGGLPVWGVAFSRDGKLLAAASYDKTIKLWRYDGKKAIPLKPLTGHRDFVVSVAFSPDGKILASGSHDSTIKLWRRNASGAFNAKPYKTFVSHSSTVSNVAFSPNGKTLASSSWDTTVKLWNLDGTLLHTFEGHTARVWRVAFSPDGQTLASGGGVDGTTRLWNLKNPKSLTFRDHQNVVLQAIFSLDHQRIASGSDDKTVKIWKSDGTVMQTLTGHSAGVLGVAFSNDMQTLASASWDGTVKLWHLDDKTEKYTLFKTLNGRNGGVWKVAISPEGAIVSTGRDGTLKLWDRKGRLSQTLTGHRAEVRSVVFSPNGQLIASSSFDKTVKLWSKGGKLLRTIENTDGVVAVTFSPDSQKLASGGVDNAIKLWTLDGKLLRTFKGHRLEVRGIAFSPDGKLIASASADRTIKLWKIDGTEIATLKGHKGAVWSVAFSPDGKQLTSASEDGTIKLWNVALALNPESLLANGCTWAHDFLQNSLDLSKQMSEASPQEARHLCDGIKQKS
jgi:WD40 repeat protein/energy-coupling factor transporter ATP-binding protein EcfA2